MEVDAAAYTNYNLDCKQEETSCLKHLNDTI